MEGGLKSHQQAMTIEEQIDNLKANGLIISDTSYAERVLNNISYFRLIKAYSLGLKEKNGAYYDNVKFENIVELYEFNAHLRQLLSPIIERVEIVLRCRLSNYFCCKYGVLGYKDKDYFQVEKYHEEFLKNLNDELERNTNSPFVKNFQENYDGGELPLYAVVEILSFGNLSKFYKNLRNEDKKAISTQYRIGYTYFESWIESIANVRNICAHYGRLYNARMYKTPALYKEYSDRGIRNNRLFGVLICLKHIIDDEQMWGDFVNKIDALSAKYPNADLSLMGFTDDWKALLSK